MCASAWVCNPERAMKVNAVSAAEVGSLSGVHHRPTMILREKGLSVSRHVGTRKMVNYA
jgi:hypothetical protein